MQQSLIVVCDSDPAFFSALEKSDVPHIRFLPAKSFEEAEKLIANPENRLAAVCINPGIFAAGLIPLIRFCHSHRPGTPLTLLTDPTSILPADFDLAALHVQKVLQKPLDPRQLAKELIPPSTFETGTAIHSANSADADAGETAEQDDENMHAIEAGSFLCGAISFFDVYVKLSDKKYMKILQAKDHFDAERINSYLRKGVRHFFIKKEDQASFLQYCDKLTQAIVSRPGHSAELKQRQVQNLGKETMDMLKTLGVSEESLRSASKFVAYSHQLIKSIDRKSKPGLAIFFNQLKESDHCAGTLLITSLLLEAMNFRDEDLISSIALGSFLHDIGLYMLPGKLGEAKYSELNGQERTLYERHPNLGADAIAQIPKMSPLVVQIIRQHHERRDRKGYPDKLGPGAIIPVAEVVGIADVFQEIISGKNDDPDFDPLSEIEKTQFDKFSLTVVEAFQKAFHMQKK